MFARNKKSGSNRYLRALHVTMLVESGKRLAFRTTARELRSSKKDARWYHIVLLGPYITEIMSLFFWRR